MRAPRNLPFLRLCRRNHLSVVSSRDIAIDFENLDPSKKAKASSEIYRQYPRNLTDFQSEYIDGSGAERNVHLVELMNRLGNSNELMEKRTEPLQQFLGPKFELCSSDLLLILCGLANLKTEDSFSPAGSGVSTSLLGRGLIHQNSLREHGKRYFQLQWNNATIFSGISHLSSPRGNIEQTVDYFKNPDDLIIEFMKRQLLLNCLIPYKATSSFGLLSRDDVIAARDAIRHQTAVGSFYTMLGVLLLRFEKETVDQEILHQKILEGRNGLYSIASLDRD